MKDLIKEVYQEFKQRQDNKGKQAFDVLDREIVQSVIVDGQTYWFEWAGYATDNDIKALVEVKNYLSNKGLTYLYD